MYSFTGRSQTLQGTVTDISTGKPLYLVTVVNVFTQQSTATSENGQYSIPAKPGDVIAWSYIGFKTVQKTIPLAEVIASLNIIMEPTDYQLEEFRLHPGHLTQYQLDSAERASIYKLPLQREHPQPFISPVSAIAEKFSRKARRTYDFQKIFAAGEIEKFIDTRYTPTLVNVLTGLSGDSIGHFMYANPMPYDFARTASDLEVKMWIRNNYKTWIKIAAKDTVTKQ